MHTMTSEVQISDWENYVAQDQVGEWWEYSHKPVVDGDAGYWAAIQGRASRIAVGPRRADWTQEICDVIRE